jgi:hypothetical protein
MTNCDRQSVINQFQSTHIADSGAMGASFGLGMLVMWILRFCLLDQYSVLRNVPRRRAPVPAYRNRADIAGCQVLPFKSARYLG